MFECHLLFHNKLHWYFYEQICLAEQQVYLLDLQILEFCSGIFGIFEIL